MREIYKIRTDITKIDKKEKKNANLFCNFAMLTTPLINAIIIKHSTRASVKTVT